LCVSATFHPVNLFSVRRNSTVGGTRECAIGEPFGTPPRDYILLKPRKLLYNVTVMEHLQKSVEKWLDGR